MPRFLGVDSRRRGSGGVHGSGRLVASDDPSPFSPSAKSPQQQETWSEDEFQLENDTGATTTTANTPLVVVVSPEQVEAPVLPVVDPPSFIRDGLPSPPSADGKNATPVVPVVLLPMVSPHPRRRRKRKTSATRSTPTPSFATVEEGDTPTNHQEDVMAHVVSRSRLSSLSMTVEEDAVGWSVPSSVLQQPRQDDTSKDRLVECHVPPPMSPRRSPRRRAATRRAATVSYAEWCDDIDALDESHHDDDNDDNDNDNDERSTTRITSQHDTDTIICDATPSRIKNMIPAKPPSFQRSNHDTGNINNDDDDDDGDQENRVKRANRCVLESSTSTVGNHAAVDRRERKRHMKKVVEDVEWIHVHAIHKSSSATTTTTTNTTRKQTPPCTCLETRQNDCPVSRTERSRDQKSAATQPISKRTFKRPKTMHPRVMMMDDTETNKNPISAASSNHQRKRLLLRFIRTKKKNMTDKDTPLQGPHFEMVPSDRFLTQQAVQDTFASASVPSDESNQMIHWESHMLHLIRKRCLEEGPSLGHNFPVPLHMSHLDGTLSSSSSGTANRTNPEMLRLQLCLESKNRDATNTRRGRSGTGTGTGREDFHVIGTLQDVMRMHVKYNSGPIPESVIAWMVLEAIQILSMTHKMGVLHNDLGLDSFVVAKHSSSSQSSSSSKWHLYMVGFGAASSILTLNNGSNNSNINNSNSNINNNATACHLWHFEHDLYGLANILHLLLTGGAPMAWTLGCSGDYTLESKSLISKNQYLRGGLAWDTLLEALLNAPHCHTGLQSLLKSTNPATKTTATTGSSKDESSDVWPALSHAVKMVEMVAAMGHDVSESRFLDDILDHVTQEERNNQATTDIELDAHDHRSFRPATRDKVRSSKLLLIHNLPHATPLDDDDDDTTAEHEL
eukprot:scaffold421302_cov49-Attheya_sp.AAC.3